VSMRRRLEDLEGRAKRWRVPEHPSDARGFARQRMREHLEQVARLRRGELDPEEAAEVEAMNAALESRLAQIRGGG
jgi:hypothetical protein